MTVAAETVPEFDLAQHHRDKIRRLEQSVAWHETYRAKLEQLLAAALVVAVGSSGCPPLALLDLLEELHDAGLPVAQLRAVLDPEPVLPAPRTGAV